MANVTTNPVGTGPFKFGSYTPGDKLQATRFDGYWQSGKPYLDQLVTKILPDPQAQLANLQTGTIDYVSTIPLPDAARLKAEGKINVQSTPPGGLWHAFALNTTKKPLDNKLVRQALNWATNRDQISKLAFQGLNLPTQVRYTPDQPWYDQKAATMYTFDLNRAKALLQQANVATPINLSIQTEEVGLPGSRAAATVWAQDLQKIGVNVTINDLAAQLFVDNWNKGNYDMALFGTGDGKLDPATQLVAGSIVRPSNNRCHIETQPFYERYKMLIQQGASTVDPKVRKPIYDQIWELWNDESWQIIFAFWTEFYGLTQSVKGFHYQVDAYESWTDVWVQS
jgi:peptide/nickel transport system substrate-binding protein